MPRVAVLTASDRNRSFPDLLGACSRPEANQPLGRRPAMKACVNWRGLIVAAGRDLKPIMGESTP